jgi:hypothetical protein
MDKLIIGIDILPEPPKVIQVEEPIEDNITDTITINKNNPVNEMIETKEADSIISFFPISLYQIAFLE